MVTFKVLPFRAFFVASNQLIKQFRNLFITCNIIILLTLKCVKYFIAFPRLNDAIRTSIVSTRRHLASSSILLVIIVLDVYKQIWPEVALLPLVQAESHFTFVDVSANTHGFRLTFVDVSVNHSTHGFRQASATSIASTINTRCR